MQLGCTNAYSMGRHHLPLRWFIKAVQSRVWKIPFPFRLCWRVRIKCKIGLILRLIIYRMFGKFHFKLDYGIKFELSTKTMRLAISIEIWV